MATKFTKNQEVKIKAVIPQGPVIALRMTEDGVFFYLVQWTDIDGVSQKRWFEESKLAAV
jgi:hypothetical protein